MSEAARQIAENVARVQDRIAAAAERSGRSASDVSLVAVTKYVGPDEVRALVAVGCRNFGESRPQELWRKADALRDASIHWHLIGHLQRNKIRRTLPMVSMIHSGDSERLFSAVDEHCKQTSRTMDLLLAVNISGDESKHGFAPSELEASFAAMASLESVRIRGLMAMASATGGLGRARQDFEKLRQLRDRLVPLCPPTMTLNELSMGMSGDFEVAIEEGATIVRVGSELFKGLANGK